MKFASTAATVMAAITLCTTNLASAADWKPAGPLKIQIGFQAGGATDTLGRLVAKTMKEQTGWNVIAENKPGGGGVAMFTGIAKAPANGQLIGLGVNMPVMINLVMRADKLSFTADSFDYLGTVARAQLALISKTETEFNDIAGLIEYSKANGGAAIAFDAKPQELILRRINKETGAGFKPVSTKGGAEIIKLLLGGQVVAGFNAGTHLPYIEKGTMKMLASANDARHNYAPETKTVREQGFDVYVDPVFYFAAPKGLSDEARTALSTALDNAVTSAAVKDGVAKALKSEAFNMGPDGTRKMLIDGMQNVKVLFGK